MLSTGCRVKGQQNGFDRLANLVGKLTLRVYLAENIGNPLTRIQPQEITMSRWKAGVLTLCSAWTELLVCRRASQEWGSYPYEEAGIPSCKYRKHRKSTCKLEIKYLFVNVLKVCQEDRLRFMEAQLAELSNHVSVSRSISRQVSRSESPHFRQSPASRGRPLHSGR